MSQNIKFDPLLKDYVFENGSPLPTDNVLEATYYALAIPKNNHLYAEQNQGSLLYKMKNIKKTNSAEQTFAAYAKDAITEQVINTGQASEVSTQNLESTRNGTNNLIQVVPSATQLSEQYEFVSV
jgi:phage gp46-like protein